MADVSSLADALIEFHRAPGKYSVSGRQPAALFDAIGQILRVAAGGPPEGRREVQVRAAAQFFVRSALFHPGADHYELLGLAPAADSAAVREHYRLVMRLIHPDFADAGVGAWPEDAASRVNVAYDVLASAEKREKYDRELRAKTATVVQVAPELRPRPAARTRQPVTRNSRHYFARAAIGFGSIAAAVLALLAWSTHDTDSLVQRGSDQVSSGVPARATVTVKSADGTSPVEERHAPSVSANVSGPEVARAALRTPSAVRPTVVAPAEAAAPPVVLPQARATDVAIAANNDSLSSRRASGVAVAAAQPRATVKADALQVQSDPKQLDKLAVVAARERQGSLANVIAPTRAPAVIASASGPQPARIALPIGTTAIAQFGVAQPAPPPVAATDPQHVQPVAAAPSTASASAVPSGSRVPVFTAAVAATVDGPAERSRDLPVSRRPVPGEMTAAVPALPPRETSAAPPSRRPTMAQTQPLLSNLLQELESGSGSRILDLLDRQERTSQSAQALVRLYESAVEGARSVRLSHVRLKAQPKDDRLVIVGAVRLHLGDDAIGSSGKELPLEAEFVSRGGAIVLSRLAAAPVGERPVNP